MALLMNSKHVATTPDELAIERGLSASVGLLGGLAFSVAAVAALGATPAMAGAIALLFLSAAPLGIIAANKTLTTESSERPVLEMMRYSAVALPIILVVELMLGGHALGLMGDFVGSLPMFGPRFVLSLIAAGFAHALACRVVWDDEDRSRPAARPAADWQTRYVEARSRLATVSVETRRRREAEELDLAAFDRRLAESCGTNAEWVLDVDACAAENVESEETIVSVSTVA